MKIHPICIETDEHQEARTVVLATSEVVDADGGRTGSTTMSVLKPNMAAIHELPAAVTERAALLCAVMLGEALPFAGTGNVLTRMRNAYQAPHSIISGMVGVQASCLNREGT